MSLDKWEKSTSVFANIAAVVATVIVVIGFFVGKDVVSDVKYLSEQDVKHTMVTNVRKAIFQGDVDAVIPQISELSKYPEYLGIEERFDILKESDEATNMIFDGDYQERQQVSDYLLNGVGIKQ